MILSVFEITAMISTSGNDEVSVVVAGDGLDGDEPIWYFI